MLGLFDKSGGKVVEYTYDSWGKLISVAGSKAGTLGAANPFRYRGYYYDSESGLYYLNSRYYDPETGRFVNADGVLGANQDLLGYNLFAYCSNNPVNYSDPSGRVMTEAALFDAMIKGFMLAAFIQAASYIILNQDVQSGFSEFSQSVSNFFSDLGSGIANAWNDFTDSVGMWCVTAYGTIKIKGINRKLYKKYKYSLKYFSGKSNPRDLEKECFNGQ